MASRMRVIQSASPGQVASFARLRLCLMKNTHNLGFKFREFEGEHNAARMQDQIEALRAADPR